MQAYSIEPTHDARLAAALDATIANKTKPPGSLGQLESIARQLGLIQRTTRPELKAPAILVFAADHGVVEEGISAYPQSVTWQMVENFLAQGAAINVFARQNGCALRIIDAGVNHDFGAREGLLDCKIARGTRNFARESAMTREQCLLAMRHGREQVVALAGNIVGFGEMGIGNTTAAAAIMHRITGLPVEVCIGAGAGVPPKGLAHKQDVIARATALHAADSRDPLDILTAFGGFEIAMMAGAMLAAAERRMILLIDGFIVTSALLVASRIVPAILDYCIFAHCSNEQGHARMLEYLGARPLLNLGLRLGEGTGCALALPLVQAAAAFLRDMATFESAAVSGKLD